MLNSPPTRTVKLWNDVGSGVSGAVSRSLGAGGVVAGLDGLPVGFRGLERTFPLPREIHGPGARPIPALRPPSERVGERLVGYGVGLAVLAPPN